MTTEYNSDMDEPLLGAYIAASVSVDMNLDDVKNYVESMSEDTALESYLRDKLRKNHLSFPLEDGDEITALCKMQDGFVVGLKSGKIMLVSPPIFDIIQIHEEPVIGVFAASNYFVFVACAHNVKVWGIAQGAVLAMDPFPSPVTCVLGNMVKELILVGLDDGTIESYTILGKDVGMLAMKGVHDKMGDPSPVYDMKTNDTTNWFAVRYLNDDLAIWDHEANHLLYHFSFDGPPGLPSSFAVGGWKKLPAFFKPAEGWEVYPEIIIFSSGLAIRMAGSSIAKMTGVQRLADPDDAFWLAYSDALRKGYMPYRNKDFIISFTPPGVEKKKPSERNSQVPEIEIDLGHFFTFAEKSEANNYIAFACEKSLEVYCWAALNSRFTHRPVGRLALMKSGEAIFARFSKVFNMKGEMLKRIDPRELFETVSPDGKWIATSARGGPPLEQEPPEVLPIRPKGRTTPGSLSQSATLGDRGKKRKARGRGAGRFRRGGLRPSDSQSGDKVKKAKRKQTDPGDDSPTLLICSTSQPVEHLDIGKWTQNSFLKLKFHKNGKFMAAMFKEGLMIYSLEDKAIVREVSIDYTESSYSLKCALNRGFVVTGKDWYQVAYEIDSKTPIVQWPYSRVTFMKNGTQDAIAYSLKRLAIGKFTDQAFQEEKTISNGFEKVKILKESTMMVGSCDFGFFFYSLPKLWKLLHLEPGFTIKVGQDMPFVYALATDKNNPAYGYLDVWDMDLGLKVQQTYFGLNHVVNNKLTVKGPSLWREAAFTPIATIRHSTGMMKETWAFDFTLMSHIGKSITKAQIKDVTINEEDVEHHLMAWKQLVRLFTLEKLKPGVVDTIIRPFNINVLHLLAHRSYAKLIKEALQQGAAVIQSVFGTPLRIAIEQKSRASLDTMLWELIDMKVDRENDFLLALYHVRDDLPLLIKNGSPVLPEFLRQVIVPLPSQMCPNKVICPSEELPKELLSDSLWVNSKDFESEEPGEKITVEYLVTPFRLYVDLGSAESIKALDILTDDNIDMNVFKSLYIRTLIDMKWRQLWWFILLSTLLYWALLGIMIAVMLHYVDNFLVRGLFLTLNTWFLLVELLQFVMSPGEYVTERWNYVDMTRTILSYIWVLSDFQAWLIFWVLLLSLLRGISTFQTFDATRFYVSMIYEVIGQTLSFIWVFFYSTLSFGLLFAAVNPGEAGDFFSTWVIPYELNMGNFDAQGKGLWYWLVFMVAALVNVVIMLNLVVSILGDAFDNFQSGATSADISGKTCVLYDYERMMWWKRDCGHQQFLQICRPEGEAIDANEWAGKVEEIKKELKKSEHRMTDKMLTGMKSLKASTEDTTATDRIMGTLTEIKNDINEKISSLRNELLRAQGQAPALEDS